MSTRFGPLNTNPHGIEIMYGSVKGSAVFQQSFFYTRNKRDVAVLKLTIVDLEQETCIGSA